MCTRVWHETKECKGTGAHNRPKGSAVYDLVMKLKNVKATLGDSFPIRPSTTRSTPQPVTCGALVVSCMRYGVLDTNHLKVTLIQR